MPAGRLRVGKENLHVENPAGIGKVFGSATPAYEGGGPRRTDSLGSYRAACSTQPLLFDFDGLTRPTVSQELPR